MSQALRELIEEGYPVTIKAVQGLSAYPHGHVQRYGEYAMDVNDIPPPIAEDVLTTLFERIMQPDVIAIHRMSHLLVYNGSRLLHHRAASPLDGGTINWLRDRISGWLTLQSAFTPEPAPAM